jgi:hypothetical protein
VTVERLGRALDIYRRTASSRSALVLVAANLIPLVGVVFFGWSLLTILVLYWVENGIVGFWNIPKILLARGGLGQDVADAPVTTLQVRALGRPLGGGAGRFALVGFFLVHYGIFWLVHGLFVFLLPEFAAGTGGRFLPGCGEPDPFGNLQACDGPFGALVWSNIAIAGVALFISHGASFLLNYVGRGEYLRMSPLRQLMAPYGRVVILHLTIIFGAFVVAALGAPIGALLILVGLKTAFDLGLHLRERDGSFARPRPLEADRAT